MLAWAVIRMHNILLVLSQKLWSSGKIGPGEQNFRNISPGGPFFPEKSWSPPENNGPTCITNEFRLLLSCVLDRGSYTTTLCHTKEDQNFQGRTVLAGCFWGDQNGRTNFTRKYGPGDHFLQQKFWFPDQFFQDQNSSDSTTLQDPKELKSGCVWNRAMSCLAT